MDAAGSPRSGPAPYGLIVRHDGDARPRVRDLLAGEGPGAERPQLEFPFLVLQDGQEISLAERGSIATPSLWVSDEQAAEGGRVALHAVWRLGETCHSAQLPFKPLRLARVKRGGWRRGAAEGGRTDPDGGESARATTPAGAASRPLYRAHASEHLHTQVYRVVFSLFPLLESMDRELREAAFLGRAIAAAEVSRNLSVDFSLACVCIPGPPADAGLGVPVGDRGAASGAPRCLRAVGSAKEAARSLRLDLGRAGGPSRVPPLPHPGLVAATGGSRTPTSSPARRTRPPRLSVPPLSPGGTWPSPTAPAATGGHQPPSGLASPAPPAPSGFSSPARVPRPTTPLPPSTPAPPPASPGLFSLAAASPAKAPLLARGATAPDGRELGDAVRRLLDGGGARSLRDDLALLSLAPASEALPAGAALALAAAASAGGRADSPPREWDGEPRWPAAPLPAIERRALLLSALRGLAVAEPERAPRDLVRAAAEELNSAADHGRRPSADLTALLEAALETPSGKLEAQRVGLARALARALLRADGGARERIGREALAVADELTRGEGAAPAWASGSRGGTGCAGSEPDGEGSAPGLDRGGGSPLPEAATRAGKPPPGSGSERSGARSSPSRNTARDEGSSPQQTSRASAAPSTARTSWPPSPSPSPPRVPRRPNPLVLATSDDDRTPRGDAGSLGGSLGPSGSVSGQLGAPGPAAGVPAARGRALIPRLALPPHGGPASPTRYGSATGAAATAAALLPATSAPVLGLAGGTPTHTRNASVPTLDHLAPQLLGLTRSTRRALSMSAGVGERSPARARAGTGDAAGTWPDWPARRGSSSSELERPAAVGADRVFATPADRPFGLAPSPSRQSSGPSPFSSPAGSPTRRRLSTRGFHADDDAGSARGSLRDAGVGLDLSVVRHRRGVGGAGSQGSSRGLLPRDASSSFSSPTDPLAELAAIAAAAGESLLAGDLAAMVTVVARRGLAEPAPEPPRDAWHVSRGPRGHGSTDGRGPAFRAKPFHSPGRRTGGDRSTGRRARADRSPGGRAAPGADRAPGDGADASAPGAVKAPGAVDPATAALLRSSMAAGCGLRAHRIEFGGSTFGDSEPGSVGRARPEGSGRAEPEDSAAAEAEDAARIDRALLGSLCASLDPAACPSEAEPALAEELLVLVASLASSEVSSLETRGDEGAAAASAAASSLPPALPTSYPSLVAAALRRSARAWATSGDPEAPPPAVAALLRGFARWISRSPPTEAPWPLLEACLEEAFWVLSGATLDAGAEPADAWPAALVEAAEAGCALAAALARGARRPEAAHAALRLFARGPVGFLRDAAELGAEGVVCAAGAPARPGGDALGAPGRLVAVALDAAAAVAELAASAGTLGAAAAPTRRDDPDELPEAALRTPGDAVAPGGELGCVTRGEALGSLAWLAEPDGGLGARLARAREEVWDGEVPVPEVDGAGTAGAKGASPDAGSSVEQPGGAWSAAHAHGGARRRGEVYRPPRGADAPVDPTVAPEGSARVTTLRLLALRAFSLASASAGSPLLERTDAADALVRLHLVRYLCTSHASRQAPAEGRGPAGAPLASAPSRAQALRELARAHAEALSLLAARRPCAPVREALRRLGVADVVARELALEAEAGRVERASRRRGGAVAGRRGARTPVARGSQSPGRGVPRGEHRRGASPGALAAPAVAPRDARAPSPLGALAPATAATPRSDASPAGRGGGTAGETYDVPPESPEVTAAASPTAATGLGEGRAAPLDAPSPAEPGKSPEEGLAPPTAAELTGARLAAEASAASSLAASRRPSSAPPSEGGGSAASTARRTSSEGRAADTARRIFQVPRLSLGIAAAAAVASSRAGSSAVSCAHTASSASSSVGPCLEPSEASSTSLLDASPAAAAVAAAYVHSLALGAATLAVGGVRFAAAAGSGAASDGCAISASGPSTGDEGRRDVLRAPLSPAEPPRGRGGAADSPSGGEVAPATAAATGSGAPPSRTVGVPWLDLLGRREGVPALALGRTPSSEEAGATSSPRSARGSARPPRPPSARLSLATPRAGVTPRAGERSSRLGSTSSEPPLSARGGKAVEPPLSARGGKAAEPLPSARGGRPRRPHPTPLLPNISERVPRPPDGEAGSACSDASTAAEAGGSGAGRRPTLPALPALPVLPALGLAAVSRTVTPRAVSVAPIATRPEAPGMFGLSPGSPPRPPLAATIDSLYPPGFIPTGDLEEDALALALLDASGSDGECSATDPDSPGGSRSLTIPALRHPSSANLAGAAGSPSPSATSPLPGRAAWKLALRGVAGAIIGGVVAGSGGGDAAAACADAGPTPPSPAVPRLSLISGMRSTFAEREAAAERHVAEVAAAKRAAAGSPVPQPLARASGVPTLGLPARASGVPTLGLPARASGVPTLGLPSNVGTRASSPATDLDAPSARHGSARDGSPGAAASSRTARSTRSLPRRSSRSSRRHRRRVEAAARRESGRRPLAASPELRGELVWLGVELALDGSGGLSALAAEPYPLEVGVPPLLHSISQLMMSAAADGADAEEEEENWEWSTEGRAAATEEAGVARSPAPGSGRGSREGAPTAPRRPAPRPDLVSLALRARASSPAAPLGALRLLRLLDPRATRPGWYGRRTRLPNAAGASSTLLVAAGPGDGVVAGGVAPGDDWADGVAGDGGAGGMTTVVLKQVDLPPSAQDRSVQGDLFNEVRVFEALRGCPRACALLDVFLDPAAEAAALVLEPCPTSLGRWRRALPDDAARSGRPFDPSALSRVFLALFVQVVQAACELASRGIVHFDLKCDNVLLKPVDPRADAWGGEEAARRGDERGRAGPARPPAPGRVPVRALLTDFGESRRGARGGGVDGVRTSRAHGTDAFKAPEMLLAGGRAAAADEGDWAAGGRAGAAGAPADAAEAARRRDGDGDAALPAPRRAAGGPDRRRRAGVGAAADVWALGCLLFELFSGTLLFDDRDWVGLVGNVTGASDWIHAAGQPGRGAAGDGGGRPEASPWAPEISGASRRNLALLQAFPPEVARLISRMLIRDPEMRPGLDAVLAASTDALAAVWARGGGDELTPGELDALRLPRPHRPERAGPGRGADARRHAPRPHPLFLPADLAPGLRVAPAERLTPAAALDAGVASVIVLVDRRGPAAAGDDPAARPARDASCALGSPAAEHAIRCAAAVGVPWRALALGEGGAAALLRAASAPDGAGSALLAVCPGAERAGALAGAALALRGGHATTALEAVRALVVADLDAHLLASDWEAIRMFAPGAGVTGPAPPPHAVVPA